MVKLIFSIVVRFWGVFFQRKGLGHEHHQRCAAVTFGASSATCENSFSTLTRILTPGRRSMLQVQFGAAVIRETTHLQSVLQRYASEVSLQKETFAGVGPSTICLSAVSKCE
jgi:hypothetical protein